MNPLIPLLVKSAAGGDTGRSWWEDAYDSVANRDWVAMLGLGGAAYGAQEAARKWMQPWLGNRAAALSKSVNVPGASDKRFNTRVRGLAEQKTGVPTFIWNDPETKSPYYQRFNNETEFRTRVTSNKGEVLLPASLPTQNGVVDALSIKSKDPYGMGHEATHGETRATLQKRIKNSAPQAAHVRASNLLSAARRLPDGAGKYIMPLSHAAAAFGEPLWDALGVQSEIPNWLLKYGLPGVIHAPRVLDEAWATARGMHNARYLGSKRLNRLAPAQGKAGRRGLVLGLGSYLAEPIAALLGNYLVSNMPGWFGGK